MDEKARDNDKISDTRRPYEAPVIEETAAFETLSLACTFSPGPKGCGAGAQNS